MSRHRRKQRTLSPTIRRSLYVISLGVWISGTLWLVLHHFFPKQGEFGPETNPMEPWFLKAHGAFALASIWIFGLLWNAHISKLWPSTRRRLSGSLIIGVIVCLTLTGYLLYYVGEDKPRSVISVLHWGIGLASPIFFAWHRVDFRGLWAKLFPRKDHALR